MIKKFTNFLVFFIFLITTGCGFKVINNDQKIDFKIKEITSTGDKRINFKIKNNLSIFSNNKNENVIVIALETNKDKMIKEKNIKNEITKYQININTILTVNYIKTGSKYNKTFNETGSFSVNKNNSTTLSNEKKLIDNLARQLSSKIIDDIQKRLNDN